ALARWSRMSTTPLRTPFVVSVIEGPDTGAAYTLDASSPRMLIGTSPLCAIRLRDPEVSSRQSVLVHSAGRLAIMDLGSARGTSVNGVLVERAFLHGGETVRVGRSVLVIERGAREGAVPGPST